MTDQPFESFSTRENEKDPPILKQKLEPLFQINLAPVRIQNRETAAVLVTGEARVTAVPVGVLKALSKALDLSLTTHYNCSEAVSTAYRVRAWHRDLMLNQGHLANESVQEAPIVLILAGVCESLVSMIIK